MVTTAVSRGDDDVDQLRSASAAIEGGVGDGSGGRGDGHIRTAAAGSAAAVHSLYRQTYTYIIYF